MRIEELIIDGFKSYPVRTHVSGFDESFNAITGLNGSGKSNILDAICFVLGITNMSAVRATNLQDLIYKRGQAGVTRASVTIVFDNTDRARSPVSFEAYSQITVTRQIAMGGMSKYLINGHKATQQAVQNLFQSVQLNINNPNFLIMQGKITKVLNMKPAEILSMIEEAAGTRMFEDRKDKAIKTIAKKELKVKEIKALLDEEITPKLDKLREEKRSFLEYQKATSELERLTRLAKAHEWQTLKSKHEEKSQYVDQQSSEVDRRRKDVEALQRQIASIDEELAQIERKKEKEIAKGGKLKALIEKSKTLQHEVVKAKTSLDFKATSVEEEQKKLAADAEALEALQQARDAKAEELTSLSESFASLKAEHDAATSELSKNDELLQSLLTGMASKKQAGGGGQGGYMGQLADSRAAEASARTEVEQAKLRISSLEKEVKTKEPQARKAEKEGAGLLKQLETAQAEAEKLAANLSASGWDESKERASAQRKQELSRSLNGLLESRDRLKSRLAGVDFSYSDPEPNFDRSRVKGLVASLIDLAEDRHQYSTALEICAGGRLYNVVVEDEVTGSKLLSNGKLKKRVTLIPLNKINAFVAASQRVGAAQKIAGDPSKVNLALSLVGYDDDVSKAMEYVFGNTLICADAQTAKRVTFDNAVKMKSVTLDGDVYDPAGTLSGGSKPQSGGLLVKLQELRGIERQIKAAQQELAQIERSEAGDAKHAKTKRTLDLKRHEASLLQQQVSGSNATRILGEVSAARKAIAELQQSIVDAQERQKTAASEAKRLEKEMKEFESNKDSKIDELKAKVKKMKASLQKQSVSFQTKQTEVRTTELELEGASKEVEEAAAALEEARSAFTASQTSLAAMSKDLEQQQAEADATETMLKKERAALTAFDEESASLQNAAKAKKQEVADSDLEVKQLLHTLEKAQQDLLSLTRSISSLESTHDWLVAESPQFGQPGSAYDFRKHNMPEVRRSCKKLEEQHAGLKKKVNPRVLGLIDSVEKKEGELKTMLGTVLGDKSKIEETIGELDRYKRDALQTTWQKVNGDFGEIFAELLPGNYAALQPPEGQDVTQGLEVKVRLGQIWKASLTELSGGQRSLIALSLILSLLQFKPAPMYLLDEVDAALDLSHTQHIGQLFKNRFGGSQFIVISLKEGLFNNASVIFRARFREGTSIVERTSNKAMAEQMALSGQRAAATSRSGLAGAAPQRRTAVA
ncbi:putative SMC2-chromosome segregation protein [Jaminaea rosea]|uniref:Structural maintenance of chromosomes protein n=1 Tax=Jaminaea rosea TaxID=1569628 RepID=A0A316V6H3_9BASI|nr:putative SMC2-chromosome segregation protein [Jaminaea rosea]PWN31045.1 putative SMC2-chromosome segregation protein [Jaminaea rosea]